MDTDKRVVTPRTFLYCFYCKTCDVSSFTYQYKLSRRAFFDCDKFIPNKTQRSSNYSPQTPPTKSLPHTHEFIGAYFIQISPPRWPGISQDDSNEVWAPPGQCSVPVVMHYLESTLQLLCYKLFLKVRHHRSRSTPGPSTSGFCVQRSDLPPLYWGCPTTFVI